MNSKFWKEAYNNLSEYGKNPLAVCWSRLASEEAALAGTDTIQGLAVVGKIKQEARTHHSVVTVAGTLGSSFLAWLFGATEVNPLKPHYFCRNCGAVEFVDGVTDGFDLPPKKCACGNEYGRDGHTIPYEGYAKAEQNGTIVELRVSEEFKPIAVKALHEFYNGVAEILPVMIHGEGDAWHMERYVVLPDYKAKPKVKEDGFWHISSEEYWEWQENETTFSFFVSERLNDIDRLRDITGVNPPNPMECITSEIVDALYQKRRENLAFITDKLSGIVPSFELLLRIDLLSHATGAWEENGDQLVLNGIADFNDVPAAREDIFNTIRNALAKSDIRDNGLALYVMERTRKGLFYSRGMSEDIERMLLSIGLPDWFPAYLRKVRYLFPKAHGIEYLLVDIILEWYSINFPAEFKKVKEQSE
jgi:DNA polymerase-3 subunit alpha (Gram-positive type)